MSELVWEEGKEKDGTPNLIAKIGDGNEFCICGRTLYLQTRKAVEWIDLYTGDSIILKQKAERINQIIKE